MNGDLSQALLLKRTCREQEGGTYGATMALPPAHLVEKGKWDAIEAVRGQSSTPELKWSETITR